MSDVDIFHPSYSIPTPDFYIHNETGYSSADIRKLANLAWRAEGLDLEGQKKLRSILRDNFIRYEYPWVLHVHYYSPGKQDSPVYVKLNNNGDWVRHGKMAVDKFLGIVRPPFRGVDPLESLAGLAGHVPDVVAYHVLFRLLHIKLEDQRGSAVRYLEPAKEQQTQVMELLHKTGCNLSFGPESELNPDVENKKVQLHKTRTSRLLAAAKENQDRLYDVRTIEVKRKSAEGHAASVLEHLAEAEKAAAELAALEK